MRRQRASGMSKMKLKTLILSAVAAAAFAAPALAQSPAAWEMPKKGDWIITGRVTDVFSEADNAITTAAGVDSGLKVDVGAVSYTHLTLPTKRIV